MERHAVRVWEQVEACTVSVEEHTSSEVVDTCVASGRVQVVETDVVSGRVVHRQRAANQAESLGAAFLIPSPISLCFSQKSPIV